MYSIYDSRTPLDRESDSVATSSTDRARRVGLSASADRAREPPIVAQLANMASAMPLYAEDLTNQDEHIELEFSLGVLYNNVFYAGVRHDDWRAIDHFCRANQLAEPITRESSVDYWYNDCAQLLTNYSLVMPSPRFRNRVPTSTPRLRVSTRGEGGDVSECQMKMPCVVQTASARFSYDTRVHVNYERRVPLLASQMITAPDGWSCKRSKTRTIVRLQSAPDWQIHLTIVLQGADEDILYEVEFEYAPRQPLVGTLVARRDALVRSVSALVRDVLEPLNRVRGLARTMGPSTLPRLMSELPSVGYDDAREVERICRMCSRDSRQLFVGVIPQNLARTQLHDLRADADHVWATEKTDGARMLLIISRRGLFVVNRDNAVTAFDSRWAAFCAELQNNSALCQHGPTVLDGELVERHGTHNEYTLVVFDLLMNNGCPTFTSAFDKKADEMHRLVTDVMRPALERIPANKRPFDCRGKRFLPLGRAASLTHRMERVREREYVFRYDKTHAFVIDGFVLVHAPVGKPVRHYKWKPLSRITVDFAPVAIGAGRVRLEADADGASALPIAEIALTEREWYQMTRVQLDSELATRMQPPSTPMNTLPVVECAYDPTTCTWRFVAYRTDKRKADHVSVLVSTVLGMVDPISLGELFSAPK